MENIFKRSIKKIGLVGAVVGSLGAGVKNSEAQPTQTKPQTSVEQNIQDKLGYFLTQESTESTPTLINKIKDQKNLVLNIDPNIPEYKRDSLEFDPAFGRYQVKITKNGFNISVEIYSKEDKRRGFVAGTLNLVISPEIPGNDPNELFANITATTSGKILSSETNINAEKVLNSALKEFLK